MSEGEDLAWGIRVEEGVASDDCGENVDEPKDEEGEASTGVSWKEPPFRE